MLHRLWFLPCVIALLNLSDRVVGQDAARIEFFEKSIRPLFIGQCQECHGAAGKKVRGGLKMMTRSELLAGGDSGPAIVPGDAKASLLVKAIHYSGDDLKMPPSGKLKPQQIADIEAWIQSGAVWPESKSPELVKSKVAGEFSETQKSHWSFQPVRAVVPPSGSPNPIDAFLLQSLQAKNFTMAPPADRRTLIRRVSYDLIGLPPTPEEVDAFVNDTSSRAFEKVVDRLLASPHYGERWGRHWLDVARYADSNGLDENTAFGNAWRYRDYVVKSFNDDKPYDRFLTEQIAGDLLPEATTNPDPLTATGFLVLGPKLLAEPDKQKMKLDIADEQLDTLGKAFLGLTLGCARCHDHKFDPILTRDYYSLLSVFTSTRTMKNLSTVAAAHERVLPTGEPQAVVDARNRKITEKSAEIAKFTEELRAKILTEAKSKLADYLLAIADSGGTSGLSRMEAAKGKIPGSIIVEAEKYNRGTADKDDQTYGQGIGIILSLKPENTRAEYSITVPAAGDYDLEFRYAALESRPVRVSVAGKAVLNVAAKETTGGWNPEHQAWRHQGRIPLVAGKNNFVLEAGVLFPHIDKIAILPLETTTALTGQRPTSGPLSDVSIRRKLHPELARQLDDFLTAQSSGNPLFGLWKAVSRLPDEGFAKAFPAAVEPFRQSVSAELLDGPAPASLKDFATKYTESVRSSDTTKAALFGKKGPFTLKGSLPANPEVFYPMEMARLTDLNQELTTIQKTAPPTLMVLAVDEGAKYPEVKGDGKPRSLFVQIRGSYLSPGEEATPTLPKIFTGRKSQFIGGTINEDLPKSEPNQTRYGRSRASSGRLELARWMTDPANPLTARVIVNRVWKQHFGEGIVRSVDNFGLLGDKPTHPELLDWLATEFTRNGWSLKKLHQQMLLTNAYQQASVNPKNDPQLDPENALLGHYPVRRLEAEPIRDGLLFVAGNLDLKLGGSLLQNGNFAYVTNSKELEVTRYEHTRRSLYLPIIRNTVYDLLNNFDFAEPHVANGRRSSTVVAPQALFWMNNPVVRRQSTLFAQRLLKLPTDDVGRIREAYLLAYSRPATDSEIARGITFLGRYESALAETEKDSARRNLKAWSAFAQTLFAASEFIYLR